MNKKKDILTILIFFTVSLCGILSLIYETNLLLHRWNWWIFIFDIFIFNVTCFGIFIFTITFRIFLNKHKPKK